MVRRILKVLAIGFGLLLVALAAFVAYAFATWSSRVSFPATPFPEGIVASADPAVIERGRYLVNGPAHCAQCHSGAEREHPEQVLTTPLQGGLEFAMGPIATTWAANLAPDPETGIGRRTDAELARAIRSGVLADGSYSLFMAVSAAKPSDEALVAIVSYLRSLPPVSNPVPKGEWGPLGKVMLTLIAIGPAEGGAPAHVSESDVPSPERGAYLAEQVALCTTCHSAFDMAAMKPTGPKGAGSLPDPSHGTDSDMEFVAPNLTADPSGVAGRLDEEAFVARIRHGRVHVSSIMPWENLGQMTDADLRSIYRYLRALPPVANDLGPTYRKAGWKPGDPA